MPESPVAQVLAALPSAPADGRRLIVALAGPPTAGKSTLAEAIVRQLDDRAITLGLDAFHFDDAVLDARGDRSRKGAPHTYDVGGYAALLDRLRMPTAEPIALPVFDRELELTRAAAEICEPHHRVIITEGNWLLLDESPWNQLAPRFDLTAFVSTDLATVERRILERWQRLGFDRADANHRAQQNDLPNARLALASSRPADMTIHT